ncbi:hypothetical protein PHYPSEUDO_005017 [Phytophthora pseudosyringae]|uniref:Protein kinase domain-containing protein n=1 Tax=Phytophthora pseudosyringae TaxID=221518 RepID=A0A8T1VQ84_9STRA|nr:hypothetical protein PHYPSEUDO_005017 [Phytophthora pseudosyringae]
MLRLPWLGALALATSGGLPALADYSTVEIYSDANCKSIPLVVTLEMTNTTCTKTDTCSAIEISNSSYYYAERCATDRFEYTSQLFSGAKYLMIDGFNEKGCASYARSNVFLAAGTCQLASYVGVRSEIATLFNDGSAYMTIYNDSACATKAQTFDLKASTVQDHTCYLGYNRFYTSDHTGILTGSSTGSGSGSGSNTTASTSTSHDSTMTAGALFGIVVACLAIVILPALLIYWKMRRSKQKEQKRNNDNRVRTPDVALAVSDKHENEERYAPDMSPRSDQRSTFSSHTGGSGQVQRSNELRCDPLRSDELRGTPLHIDRHRKDEQRSAKVRGDELRNGGRVRSDRFRGDSIGHSGRLHTDELRSTPVRGNKLQRGDLSNNTIHSDPVRSDRLKNERQRKERQRKERPRGDEPSDRSDQTRSDRDRMPSDPVRSDRMRSKELRSHRAPSDPLRSVKARATEPRAEPPQAQPIHAQRLRGPVTADSVCEDDTILSSRIPRDSVFVEDLIGRGGYGEVYKGTYEGRAVAVKMLFPETRKSTRHVTEFLTEVKMMTVMDHPRVVDGGADGVVLLPTLPLLSGLWHPIYTS